MAGAAVASMLSECHISASQEEVLANLREGWERDQRHYSLDETPSQTLGGFQSPRSPYDGEEDGEEESSEASESEDGEGNLGFTQEPVVWISPPSSPHANVGGAEGSADGMAKEDSVVAGAEGSDDGVAKKDCFLSPLDSDLSQSPSDDWHAQMEESDPQPNLGVGAEFLTQPALGGINAEFLTQPPLGVMDLQFTSSEDVDDQILRRETVPEAEFVPLRRRSLPLLSPIAKNSVIGIPLLVLDCIQPFTQAFESQLPQSHNHIQEPVEQMEAIEERNEIHHPPVLDKDRPGTEEPQPTQQGRGGELVRDAPALDNDEFEMVGEQSSEGRGGDELLPTGSRMSVDDTRHMRSTEHKQELEHDRSSDVPLVEEVHNDAGVSEKAQPVVECVTERIPANADLVQRGNGDTSSPSKALKRVSGADELHGQQKRPRVEVSPARAQSVPKTVMDVVRSYSRPLSSPPVDDECSILSIMMRAGLSFPPFVNDKRSV